ncbi:MAG TPA: hypothetical protein VJR02_15195 [Pyrinomonadaceae bacterium]|nr:hypothetical protein [Pyrinomonadaceae bacterium]
MEIIYSSGLHIADRSELSSLAIVYEKIYLPASDHRTCSEGVILRKEVKDTTRLKLVITAVRGWTFTDRESGKQVDADEFILNWNHQNELLFSEGVLERLSPSSELDHSDTVNLTNTYLDEIASPILRMPYLVQNEQHIYLWQDHLDHLLREDLILPSLFTSRNSTFSREMMKALLIFPAFNYLIPKASALTSDQILTVRNKTKDNREGFNYYIQELTSEVENRIKNGDTIEAVSQYATSVAETKIIPKFREFTRQIQAERAGFWKNALDRTGKVFEIDAAPWTPKFWGELVKALGLGFLSTVEERKKNLSNEVQAFKFLRCVERVSKKI